MAETLVFHELGFDKQIDGKSSRQATLAYPTPDIIEVRTEKDAHLSEAGLYAAYVAVRSQRVIDLVYHYREVPINPSRLDVLKLTAEQSTATALISQFDNIKNTGPLTDIEKLGIGLLALEAAANYREEL